jgi:hypothetical protein
MTRGVTRSGENPDTLAATPLTRPPGYGCVVTPEIVGRHIPNSPTNVIDAGLTAEHPSGWFGSIRALWL